MMWRIGDVYIVKPIGPTIEPCGNPKLTGRGADSVPLILTQDDLPVR
jgi:hypothetical protein